MSNIVEITDLAAPELDVFARLTEAQLRSRAEAEKALDAMHVQTFRTKIRRTEKVPESTLSLRPLREYSPRSSAAIDYRSLAGELMEEV